MKKTSFVVLVICILTTVLLVTPLTACGYACRGALTMLPEARSKSESRYEAAEPADEEVPVQKAALDEAELDAAMVSEEQFNACTSAEALNNMTVFSDEHIRYIFSDGTIANNIQASTSYYNNDFVYLDVVDIPILYQMTKDSRLVTYQLLDDSLAEYYGRERKNDFTPGHWNLISGSQSRYTTAGERFIFCYGPGTFDEYTFDPATGRYVSEQPVWLNSGMVRLREITFNDGQIVRYAYVQKHNLSGGTSGDYTAVFDISDQGTTYIELPDELAALMEKYK